MPEKERELNGMRWTVNVCPDCLPRVLVGGRTLDGKTFWSCAGCRMVEVVPAAERDRYRRALLRIWVGDTGPAESVQQFAFWAVHPPEALDG